MPIILGAILVVSIMLGIRFLINTQPKMLATLIKGIVGAGAIIIIVILILSGRLLNVVIGLSALIPLLPTLKKMFHKYSKEGRESSSSLLIMTEEEARDILGVSETASAREIKAAHRRLIKKIHPDQGGSDVLAAQVNRAKDILLQEE